jgi:hypothetical protein
MAHFTHVIEAYVRPLKSSEPYTKYQYGSTVGSAEAHMMFWQERAYEVLSISVRAPGEEGSRDQQIDLVTVESETVDPFDPDLQPSDEPVDTPTYDDLMEQHDETGATDSTTTKDAGSLS